MTVDDSLVGAFATLGGALIGALATIYAARMAPFMASRRRDVRGKWVGTAEEFQAFGATRPTFARYAVSFELKQFRARVSGLITASSDDGNVFTDNIDGRLVTEQDLCFTFSSVDVNVHDFGAAVFRIHPSGNEMNGYVLSNETTSEQGRVFVMRARMARP